VELYDSAKLVTFIVLQPLRTKISVFRLFAPRLFYHRVLCLVNDFLLIGILGCAFDSERGDLIVFAKAAFSASMRLAIIAVANVINSE
jgi:hypothetical protein